MGASVHGVPASARRRVVAADDLPRRSQPAAPARHGLPRVAGAAPQPVGPPEPQQPRVAGLAEPEVPVPDDGREATAAAVDGGEDAKPGKVNGAAHGSEITGAICPVKSLSARARYRTHLTLYSAWAW